MKDPLDRVDLQLLRVFDALYVHRNATKAAEQLFVTTSAVSHSMKRLRSLFDDELFIRTSDGLIATAVSDSLHPRVRELLEQLAAILAQRTIKPEQMSGLVRLSISDYGAMMILPKMLPIFADVSPGLQFFVYSWKDETEQDMADGRVDLAIGYYADGDDILRKTLHDVHFVCIAGRNHPLAGAEKVTAADVEKFKLAWVSANAGQPPPAFLESRGITTEFELFLADFLTVPFILAESEYLCFVPRDIVVQFPNLVCELPFGIDIPCRYKMFWHRRTDNDPTLRWIRDQVTKTIAGD